MADLLLERDGSVIPDGEHDAFELAERVDGDAVRVLLVRREDADDELRAGAVSHHQRGAVFRRLRDDLRHHDEEDGAHVTDELRIDALDVVETFVARGAILDPFRHGHAQYVLHRRACAARTVARALDEGHGGLAGAHELRDEDPGDTAAADVAPSDLARVRQAFFREHILELLPLALAGVAEEDDALPDSFRFGGYFAHDDLVERA